MNLDYNELFQTDHLWKDVRFSYLYNAQISDRNKYIGAMFILYKRVKKTVDSPRPSKTFAYIIHSSASSSLKMVPLEKDRHSGLRKPISY